MAIYDITKPNPGQQPTSATPASPKQSTDWFKYPKAMIDFIDQSDASAGAVRALLRGENIATGARAGQEQDLSFRNIFEDQYRKNKGGGELNSQERLAATTLGFAADVVVDPVNLVTLGLGKLISLGSKAVLRAVPEIAQLGPKIAKSSAPVYAMATQLSNKFGMPDDMRKWIFNLGVKRYLVENEASKIGSKVAEATKGTSFTDRKTVTSYLKGDITELPQHLQPKIAVFDEARNQIDTIGKMAVDAGLLDVEDYNKNVGHYLPQLFNIFEGDNAGKTIATIMGQNSKVNYLNQTGTLQVIKPKYVNEFADTLSSAAAKSNDPVTQNMGKIVDEVREKLGAAFDWQDMKRIFKTDIDLAPHYKANKQIIDSAIDAYADHQKQIGQAMFDFLPLSRESSQIAGTGNSLNAGFRQAKKAWSVDYLELPMKQSGKGVKTTGVKKQSMTFDTQAERDAFIKEQKMAGNKILDVGAPISEAYQKALGLIQEPAHLVEESIRRVGVKVPMADFMSSMAKHAGTLTKAEYDSQRLAGNIKDFEYKMVPDNKTSYGELAGKFIPTPAYNQVFEAARINNVIEGAAIKDTLRTMTKYWKSLMTVWNPASHMRQMFSNLIALETYLQPANKGASLLGLSGATKHLPEASNMMWKAIKDDNVHKTLKEAEESGLFVGGFKNQVGALETLAPNSGNAVLKGVKKADDLAGTWWQYNDNLARLTSYLHYRELGKTPEEAVALTHKVFFNYGDVPPVVKSLDAFATPFLTYSYNASKLFFKTMLDNPKAITKWYKLERAVSSVDPRNSGFDPNQVRDYLSNNVPIYVDKNGKQKTINPTYLYPWGGVTQRNPLGLLTGTNANLPLGINLNPFISEPIQQLANKDFFFQSEIVPDKKGNVFFTPQGLKRDINMALPQVGRTLLPGGKLNTAITTGLGGKAKETGSREPSVVDALLSDVVGIKTDTLDLAKEKQTVRKQQDYEIQNLQAEISRIRKSDASPADKQKQIDKIREKIQSIRQRR